MSVASKLTHHLSLLGVSILLASGCEKSPDNQVRVIKVIDGDTFIVEHQTKTKTINLSWIDAPEREQPFGREAKAWLSDKLHNKVVVLSPDNEIMLDGTSLNRMMLAEGIAWLSPQTSGFELHFNYSDAQTQAMNSGLGLWALPHELRVPPWVWREQGKHVKKPKWRPSAAQQQAHQQGDTPER